jgi:heme transport system substrate-binding protein
MFVRISPLCRLQIGLILFVTVLMMARLVVADETRPTRVIALGGSVTEIVYVLGQQDRLVARDTTSIYPPSVFDLPDVGYVRALSPEGVLSVSPDLIIAIEGAGPPEAVDVLRDAGVPFVTVPNSFSAKGIAAKIRAVGTALGEVEAADALARKTESEIEAATMAAASVVKAGSKRVLFILSTRGGRIMASGHNTAADSIIRMAGGVNVVTEFEGYKPLTSEAIIGMAPDVILMMDRGGDHALMNDELFAMPAISVTPAARDRAVVRMNGMFLLGFGPRTMSAVSELSAALYGGS